MSRQSQTAACANDIHFNKLTQSSDHGTNLNVSNFSTSKMEEHCRSEKSYPSTPTYLKQITDKYEKMDLRRKQQDDKKNPKLPSANSSEFIFQDNHSNVTNQFHHETPLKFKTKEIPVIVVPSQQPVPVIKKIIIAPPILYKNMNKIENNKHPDIPHDLNYSLFTSNVKVEMDMQIPDDISLSKGVSERGVNNSQPNYNTHLNLNQTESKSKFFELSKRLKQELPPGHKGQHILIAQMYQQVQQLNIPERSWENWIKQALQK